MLRPQGRLARFLRDCCIRLALAHPANKVQVRRYALPTCFFMRVAARLDCGRRRCPPRTYRPRTGPRCLTERLLGDAIVGDGTLFAGQDGVEAAWAIVQPVLGL